MGKRAIVSVLTVVQKFGELRAELSLVLFNMIEPFDFVVCKWARILFSTFISFLVLT